MGRSLIEQKDKNLVKYALILIELGNNKGLNQLQIANICNLSSGVINGIYKNKYIATYPVFNKIKAALPKIKKLPNAPVKLTTKKLKEEKIKSIMTVNHSSEKLKELRQLHGLTYSKLGEKLGISRQRVEQIENKRGVKNISVLLLIKIANIYNVTLESLISKNTD